MRIIQGKSIVQGIAIGKIYFYKKMNYKIKRKLSQDPRHEMQRYLKAKDQSINQLSDLYEKALRDVGLENAQIFEVHKMMLEDEDFSETIKGSITDDHLTADFAVQSTGEQFAEMFSSMDDEYMQARAADIKDINQRLLDNLSGIRPDSALSEPSLLAASDLAPSETIQINRKHLLGLITEKSSLNSHTAILARTINLPALTAIEVKPEMSGKTAVIDGFTGQLILEPEADILAKYKAKQTAETKKRARLDELIGSVDVTQSGHKVQLSANVASLDDIKLALKNDAQGIGLFRSEFIYLEKSDYPTEEEQFLIYKEAAEQMDDKQVIIRTLDIGADKKIDYFKLAKEENPALGYRAIRICLRQPDIFKIQLRAIYRASIFGNIAVMFPMIISLDEIKQVKEIINAVKRDLDLAGHAYRDIDLGIMIETPAAALQTEEFAKEVDFFSIGTNDLSQYTLAIDRQNSSLDEFYDPHHPAILKLIEMTVINAHKAGIWVGICGELAADTQLTQLFMDMKVDELSVSPHMILPVREKIIAAK